MNQEISKLISNYKAPDELGFGQVMAPIMFRSDYANGVWQQGNLTAFGPISLNPAATALQFAQQVFEGMKAYCVSQETPFLFRPEMNFNRLNRSAKRLSMPTVPASLFAEALGQMCGALAQIFPDQPGQSMYLRPTFFGTDPQFAVKGSESFTFLLLASPSDPYYPAPIKVKIERDHCRAAVGGTGADKVGGNYAASLVATHRCLSEGFDQPLWLDPQERIYIEELSGMNIVVVIDGDLHTPSLSGSILPGVTRDALLLLARQAGMETIERRISADYLLRSIEDKKCTEAFACGTAAIVCPISLIGDTLDSARKLPAVNQIAAELKNTLLSIQEGSNPDINDWMISASDEDQLQRRLSGDG